MTHLSKRWLLSAALCMPGSGFAQAHAPDQRTDPTPMLEGRFSPTWEWSQTQQYGEHWREFLFADLSAPREDYLGIEDIDSAYADGYLYLGHDRSYALVEVKAGKVDLVPAKIQARPLPPLEVGPHYAGLKYRNRAFFMKRHDTIFQFDEAHRKWTAYFVARKTFSQFEILGNGKIVLICPHARKGAPLADSMLRMGMLASIDNENIPLLEVYSGPGAANPERTFPFPEEVADTLRRINNYPLVDRTLQMAGTYLLFNSRAGQVFCFDAGNQTVSYLAPPWQDLNSRFLRDFPDQKPRNPDGVIKLSQFAFPVKIHPYIQNSRQILFAVILNPLCEPGYSKRRDEIEMKSGNRFAPLAREYTPEERANWAWMKYYHFDIATRKFTELKQPRLSGLRLDFAEHWLTLAGDAIPLRSFAMGRE